MTTVLLVIHLLIAIALVISVLLQPSEGGGLGIGGGSAGGGAGLQGFLTGRGTANLLTRTTAILAASFMATSVTLTILAGGGGTNGSILDRVPTQTAPAESAAPDNGAATGASDGEDGGSTTGDTEPTVPVE